MDPVTIRGKTIDKHLKAIALSRQEVLSYQPLENSVLISYGGSYKGQIARRVPEKVKLRYRDVLELAVDDVISDKRDSKHLSLFSSFDVHAFDEKDCQKTRQFIEKYADAYFVVHCDAGISRSSATAYYIAEKYAPEDFKSLQKLGIYFPNPRIYGFLKDDHFDPKVYRRYD